MSPAPSNNDQDRVSNKTQNDDHPPAIDLFLESSDDDSVDEGVQYSELGHEPEKLLGYVLLPQDIDDMTLCPSEEITDLGGVSRPIECFTTKDIPENLTLKGDDDLPKQADIESEDMTCNNAIRQVYCQVGLICLISLAYLKKSLVYFFGYTSTEERDGPRIILGLLGSVGTLHG